MRRVCVNCGSNPGFNAVYMEAAGKLGRALSGRDLGLVYGGAGVGLMGKIADTVLQAGGTAIGVIPESLAHKVPHQGLTELHVVGSMHARKSMMFDLSDGFVALPGGLGTVEEVTELLTWSQLGLNDKPCGLLNINGYFDSLLTFFDTAVREGFLKKEHRNMLLLAEDPGELLDSMVAYQRPTVEKWMDGTG